MADNDMVVPWTFQVDKYMDLQVPSFQRRSGDETIKDFKQTFGLLCQNMFIFNIFSVFWIRLDAMTEDKANKKLEERKKIRKERDAQAKKEQKYK